MAELTPHTHTHNCHGQTKKNKKQTKRFLTTDLHVYKGIFNWS